ncbi:DNA mismatch repair protein PMS2 [Nematocida ausubeli]|nr:DNA mismatch repair protein PMS2 [Nematocida ausubeli]
MIKILSNEDTTAIQTEQILPDIYTLVNELIRNSIDSSSTTIVVTICATNKNIVYAVEDNGAGIEVNEHFLMKGGTSKYKEPNQYGYKGMVLYSLKTVSDFTINTKNNGKSTMVSAKNQTVCVLEGYKDTEGTSISISNYYALKPIRHNYLLSNLNKNMQQIVEMLRKYNTVHNVQFKLYKNQNILYNTPYNLLNQKMSITEKLIHIYNVQRCRVVVFTGRHSIVEYIVEMECIQEMKKNRRERKIVGVIHNKVRLFENKRIEKALHDSVNINGKVYYNIEINEEKEISVLSEIGRISKYNIQSIIENSRSTEKIMINLNEEEVNQNTGSNNEVTKTLGMENEKANKMGTRNDTMQVGVSKSSKVENLEDAAGEESEQNICDHNNRNFEEVYSMCPVKTKKDESVQAVVIDKNECLVSHKYEDGIGLSIQEISMLKIVGQFNNGFILCTLVKDSNIHMYIIDQHAADEAVNYEHLRSNIVYKRQKLIHPITIGISEYDAHLLRENTRCIEKHGFILNEEKTQIIEAPAYENTIFGSQELLEIVERIKEGRFKEEEPVIVFTSLRKVLASKACRSSIMIGDVLNMQQMNKIVKGLSKTTRPWNCPHGRPTILLLQGKKVKL